MAIAKKRKKIEQTVEKIKKPKPKDEYISKLTASRMGAPPLEDRELTEEQKKFAMLIARNIPLEMAQEQCGFSEYQRKEYLPLPKMQEEIKKWKTIFEQEEGQKTVSIWNMILEESLLYVLAHIRKGDIKNNELTFLFKNIINKSLSLPSDDDSPIKRAMKATRKMTTTPQRQPMKQLPGLQETDNADILGELAANNNDECQGEVEIEITEEYREDKADDGADDKEAV